MGTVRNSKTGATLDQRLILKIFSDNISTVQVMMIIIGAILTSLLILRIFNDVATPEKLHSVE
jgi:hypothetical protein